MEALLPCRCTHGIVEHTRDGCEARGCGCTATHLELLNYAIGYKRPGRREAVPARR